MVEKILKPERTAHKRYEWSFIGEKTESPPQLMNLNQGVVLRNLKGKCFLASLHS